MSPFRLENVVQRYREQKSGAPIEALRVRALSIEAGEILTVVGPNGSGKSTLLELLAFLRPPAEGRVLFEGADVWERKTDLAARRAVPILLQKTVLFSTSVLKNVLFGFRVRGLSSQEAQARALAALRLVHLEHLAHRRHNELSGGEQRRTALARILALDSRVLVLDEPTASLDRESEQVIEDLIRRLNRERGVTLILASHNRGQAAALSTRVVTLLGGKLVPESLDNLLPGTLRRVEGGFEFTERRGWTRRFAAAELTEDAWEGIGPVEGPVQLAISSASFAVGAAGATSGALDGVVDSVRQGDGSCRIRVRLGNGPSLYAEIPRAEYARLGLNLGARVALSVKPGAVRVFGARSGTAP